MLVLALLVEVVEVVAPPLPACAAAPPVPPEPVEAEADALEDELDDVPVWESLLLHAAVATTTSEVEKTKRRGKVPRKR